MAWKLGLQPTSHSPSKDVSGSHLDCRGAAQQGQGLNYHSRRRPGSERRALAHRRRKRAVIEIVEFTAYRHAMREPCHLDGIVGQEIDDVVRGRLSFDR